jgi:hypothetical protein
VDSLNKIINAVSYLKIEQIKHDILGKIFHNLIPKELRKRLAAYYTSNEAAELLAELAVEKPDDIILDPACGSGTLLVSCYRKKRELLKEEIPEIHKKLLKEIYGIDIALFASHLAAIHLALQEPLAFTEEVRISFGDAFTFQPGSLAPFLGKIRTRVTPGGSIKSEFEIPKVDVVIMNPPFTRSERLEKSYKQFLENSLKLSGKDKFIQKNMGLHAYFLLHADNFLKNNGRIAAVLPASTFYTGYGESLKKFFLDKYHIEYIITSNPPRVTFSEDCTFKEILFVARKVKSRQKNFRTKFVVLKGELSLENFKRMADTIVKTSDYYDANDLRINPVTVEELSKEDNWMIFTKPKINLGVIFKSNFISTGEKIFGNGIIRGVELFAPEFFFLPNKYWDVIKEMDDRIKIQNKFTKQQLEILSKNLVKALRKPELYLDIVPNIKHFLLIIPPKEKLPRDLDKYIKWGETRNLDKVKTLEIFTKERGIPWFSLMYEQLKTKSRYGRIAFCHKIRITNKNLIAHYSEELITGSKGFYFISTGNELYDKILAAWFNSSIFLALLLRYRREVAEAWSAIMIEDLLKMPCINPSKLEKNSIKKVIDAFTKFSKIRLPPLPHQIRKEYRKNLDESILEALKIDVEFLKELYNEIEEEFSILKQK